MHKLSMSHTCNKRFLKLKQKLIFLSFNLYNLNNLTKDGMFIMDDYQIAPTLHQDVNPPCD